MSSDYKNRKLCPIMSRPVIGDANPIGFGVKQFVQRITRNGSDFDVCLCEIKCYEEGCMFWEAGSKLIPARCKMGWGER